MLQISFRAGSRDRFDGGIIVNCEQYFIHPQFDRETFNCDVIDGSLMDDRRGDSLVTHDGINID